MNTAFPHFITRKPYNSQTRKDKKKKKSEKPEFCISEQKPISYTIILTSSRTLWTLRKKSSSFSKFDTGMLGKSCRYPSCENKWFTQLLLLLIPCWIRSWTILTPSAAWMKALHSSFGIILLTNWGLNSTSFTFTSVALKKKKRKKKKQLINKQTFFFLDMSNSL